MNKTAIRSFAIWARNKLIGEITYKAGLLGITEKEIKDALPQSTNDVQFFDIGTKEPYAVAGVEIMQRKKLVEVIQQKEQQSSYKTAYKSVIEEVAYTWFNRLIAIRFMEVNNYLPTGIRVLSSASSTKIEPDLVTNPFAADLGYTSYETDRIMQLKQGNQLDELFRMLFVKQCNSLNKVLPGLFEKTNDYTELLLNVSFTDQDGVVYRLVHDIPEDNFDVSEKGQVEIIGWLYQHYNTELKDETFALLKKNVKVTKERIPAATQLFTPNWIVRYMVENSLGRLWLEGHPNDVLRASWKYYLDEAEQELAVQAQLDVIREEYKQLRPEDIKVIDPCMGSGHILVYAFDVLMQIYQSQGYNPRAAAKSILQRNLYGLDIDNRAYQLAYFALMMKAREYNRRIFDEDIGCNVYAIQESNSINRSHLQFFGAGLTDLEKHYATEKMQYLLEVMHDAKEYGSLISVDQLDWDILHRFVDNVGLDGQITLQAVGLESTQALLWQLVRIAAVLAEKYDVVVTNPPYMGGQSMNAKLITYLRDNSSSGRNDLFAAFIERVITMTEENMFNAMITQHSWMFISSYRRLRKELLAWNVVNMTHLGARAFEDIGGEVVQTVAFVMRKNMLRKYTASYLRLLAYQNQQAKEEAFCTKKDLYFQNQENFSAIPGTPVAYWASPATISTFKHKQLSSFADLKQGFATGDNTRFLRLWHEVPFYKIGFDMSGREEAVASCYKWFPCNKGGPFRKWFGNNDYVANWENDGQEMRNFRDVSGKLRSRPQNMEWYFKEGLTWSTLSSASLSMRYSPQGHLFETTGSVAFICKDDHLSYILGLLNSKVVDSLLLILCPTLRFNEGPLSKLPIVIGKRQISIVNELVERCIAISLKDWDSFETSWYFKRHPLIQFKTGVLASSNGTPSCLALSTFKAWQQFAEEQFMQLKANEEELNRIFIDIYALQDELTPEVEDKDVTIRKADLSRDIRSFLSYAVGCMFGRYSLDVEGLAYAGGEWDASKYSTFIPVKDNIVPLTDEEYFEDDIVSLFCVFLRKTFGDATLEENLNFIAEALGNRGSSSREVIRNYFLQDFFKDHCRVYKKRPIYWLFDSGKADGFKALIYMHRYNADTIGNLRIDYLHKIQRAYESEITHMQDIIDSSNNAREVAAAEKRKEKLLKQLKETQEYDEKIAHLALSRIEIDLDDGVKTNYEKVQTGADGKKLSVLARI